MAFLSGVTKFATRRAAALVAFSSLTTAYIAHVGGAAVGKAAV